jgi:D-2-hydroxyacid dehydrogenase (NADP+)
MANLLMLLALPVESQKQYYEPLKVSFPELTITLVDHHSKAAPYVAAADILMTFGPMLTNDLIKNATNLKWVQALGTGVDNINDLPSFRSEIIVTNIHGIHGSAMSESAIMSMLALSRDFPRVMRNQEKCEWDRWPARLLHGKTVGIFGIGAIGEALAPRCKALGMTVLGISSVKRTVANFDGMYARDQLLEAVTGLDYLVVLTPYSTATRNLINSEILAAMKPTAYFINLARGGIVDERALMEALTNGRIAGAALDVFNEEPLPRDHPLWKTKNVIITPHLGGFNDQYAKQAIPVIEENIRRFLAGDIDNMVNVVRPTKS